MYFIFKKLPKLFLCLLLHRVFASLSLFWTAKENYQQKKPSKEMHKHNEILLHTL